MTADRDAQQGAEYDARQTARPAPPDLEHKSTAGALIGHSPALVPHASRTGAAVTDEERADAQVFPGTLAAGNGVQNDERRRDGAPGGLATDSGGTQRSGRGVTGSARTTKTTRSSTGTRSGSSSTTSGGSSTPAAGGSGSSDSSGDAGGQPKG